MKIGPEHVGRKVSKFGLGLGETTWANVIVIAVGKKTFIGECNGERLFNSDDTWELVEEPKKELKPSEIIWEIFRTRFGGKGGRVTDCACLNYSILAYLDEEAAKEKP